MTYRLNGEIVTKEEFMKDSKGIIAGNVGLQIGGFQSFISPLDGTRISSTQQLRDHEKKYNKVQVGNDFKTKMDKNRRVVYGERGKKRGELRD